MKCKHCNATRAKACPITSRPVIIPGCILYDEEAHDIARARAKQNMPKEKPIKGRKQRGYEQTISALRLFADALENAPPGALERTSVYYRFHRKKKPGPPLREAEQVAEIKRRVESGERASTVANELARGDGKARGRILSRYNRRK